jgi:hypothetical protein
MSDSVHNWNVVLSTLLQLFRDWNCLVDTGAGVIVSEGLATSIQSMSLWSATNGHSI